MKRVLSLVAISVFTLTISSSLMAQSQDSGHWRGNHGRGNPPTAKNMEDLRLLKLLEVLDLSEEQSDKFIPVFRKHRKKIRELRKERFGILDTLSQLVNKENSDGDIERMFSFLSDSESKLRTEKHNFFTGVAEIFNINQRAIFILFRERFERRLLDSMLEFRNKHGNVPGNEDE